MKQDYPPLPDSSEFGPWNYTDDQMRAYVDADRALREQSQGVPDGWRELLQQSNGNCVRNFGSNPISEWVYDDLAELFSAAPQAQPESKPIDNTSVITEFCKTVASTQYQLFLSGVRFAEAFHNIKEKP